MYNEFTHTHSIVLCIETNRRIHTEEYEIEEKIKEANDEIEVE